MKLTIDFETRSAKDIKFGAYAYAKDPSTKVLCLSVAVDDYPAAIYIPNDVPVNESQLRYQRITESNLLDLIKKADRIQAFNCMFEYCIWNFATRWPRLAMKRFYDSQAQCGYCALPQSLDEACKVLNLRNKKGSEGKDLIRKLCKPDKDGNFNEDPNLLAALCNYCCEDVDAERELANTIIELPEMERRIWLLNQKINLLGVPFDIENVKRIVDAVTRREAELLRQFQIAVDGNVSGPRSYVALRRWVEKELGVEIPGVNKEETERMLGDKSIPANVRKALAVKSEIAKSSVAKFKAILACTGEDERVRGMFRYAGASTLRWTANMVQVHNLPRDSYKPEDCDKISWLLSRGKEAALPMLYAEIMFVASRMIRGSIKSPAGKVFLANDYKSIEARGLAYLAGEEHILDIFRKDECVYRHAAKNIYNIAYDEVTKDQRQVGKASDLSLGYGGGIGAFVSMAANYGIDLETLPEHILPKATFDEMEGSYGARAIAAMYLKTNPDAKISYQAAVACDVIKRKWRANHPATSAFWKELENAAICALASPDQIFNCGRIRFLFDTRRDFLKLLMPSGRLMLYYQPRMRKVPTPWDPSHSAITYMGMKITEGKTSRQWTRIPTYGGKLSENVVQGFCRDLLAQAMLRVDAAGMDIPMHVHDEIVVEAKDASRMEEFSQLMSFCPDWAWGMPIQVEGWIGGRYQK